jgi:hypothetical protein
MGYCAAYIQAPVASLALLPISGCLRVNVFNMLPWAFQHATQPSCESAVPVRLGFTFHNGWTVTRPRTPVTRHVRPIYDPISGWRCRAGYSRGLFAGANDQHLRVQMDTKSPASPNRFPNCKSAHQISRMLLLAEGIATFRACLRSGVHDLLEAFHASSVKRKWFNVNETNHLLIHFV